LVFTTASIAVEIISITSQTDSVLTFIVEDVGLSNIVNNPTQSGIGIGSTSDQNVYDCLIINLNSEGIPVFATIPDYAVPINLIPDIVNRFASYNYIQDFIPADQPGNNFQIGDIIYLNQNGSYTASISTLLRSMQSIGEVTSVNQPDVGNFTYRPINRYVTNLPTLPGFPGDILYVSSTVPGGVTNVVTTGDTIPVYIKITDNSAIFTSGSGGSANNIPAGEIAFGGPGGQLIGNSALTFDTATQTLKIGNIEITGDYITTAAPGDTYTLNIANPPTNGLIVSGNVGVGTAVPVQKLQVVGNIQITNSAGSLSGIWFSDGTYQATSAASYSTPAGGPVNSVQYNTGAGFGGSNNFVFSSNEVGIGTNSPTHILDVQSTTSVASFATRSNNDYQIYIGNNAPSGNIAVVGYSNSTRSQPSF